MYRHRTVNAGAACMLVSVMLAALPVSAATIPDAVQAALVHVVCGDRQGSGVLTDDDHILTVGHVPVDPGTREAAETCRVGFIADPGDGSDSFFRAGVVHAVLSPKYDLDFAVLRIGERLQGPAVSPAPLPVDVFAQEDADVLVAGFPRDQDGIAAEEGTIRGFSRGTVVTDAVISEGYSGGPGVDADGELIGIASRFTFLKDPDTGEEYGHRYLLGDMATMISWIDALGTDTHEAFMSHADPARWASLPYFIRDEEPGCLDVVRTPDSSAVYCLLTESRRFVFPNASVYHSWYDDFSPVEYALTRDIADFTLVGNMTYRAGTLVKVRTDPKVYLVTDTFGTLRPIETEQRALELFGEDWAALVRDVPDAFFVDYSVGRPI